MGIIEKKMNKSKYAGPIGGSYPVREIKDLKELINSGASLYGDKTAFLAKKEKAGDYFSISYNRLKDDIEALGSTLLDMGLKGEKIAVIGSNSYQWVVTYFAVANGVGVIVPLDKELKKEEIENLVKTASCKAIFYSKEFANLIEDIDVKHKFIMNSYEQEEDKENPETCSALIEEGKHLIENGYMGYIEKEIDPEVMSVILFTSGTTGVAKGVMLSHKNIVTVIMGMSGYAELNSDDVFLSVLPIHHTFESSMSIMTVLYQGASTAFYEGLKYILKNIQESEATAIIGVPLIMETLFNRIWTQAKKMKKDKLLNAAIKVNKKALSMGIDKRRVIFKSVYSNFGGKLRFVFSGAAALNPNTLRGFIDLGFDMVQGYGLTECAPVVTATPMWENIYGHAGSCGKVIPGGQLKIFEPDDQGIGEICYKGENVMLGYYNMPEETAKVIKDGWFHTGDLGFIDPEGWLYITGRHKNVIVTKTGKNIYPEELEAKLNDDEMVIETMVFAIEEGDSDTEVGAQIYPDYEKFKEELNIDVNEEGISEEEKEKRRDEIYNILDEKIKAINMDWAVYKRIKKIIVRENDFIRTTTKKIKRKETIAEYSNYL